MNVKNNTAAVSEFKGFSGEKASRPSKAGGGGTDTGLMNQPPRSGSVSKTPAGSDEGQRAELGGISSWIQLHKCSQYAYQQDTPPYNMEPIKACVPSQAKS